MLNSKRRIIYGLFNQESRGGSNPISIIATTSSSTSLTVNAKVSCGTFSLAWGYDPTPTFPTLYAVIDGSNVEVNSTNFTILEHGGIAMNIRNFINDKAYKDKTISQLKFNSTIGGGKYQISAFIKG